jgi:hypothetical protein
MRLPTPDADGRNSPRTRSRLRTAILILAPSAIGIAGVWLASVAGLALVKDRLESGLMIMVGGTALAVTAALGVIVLIDRRSRRDA